ncbi:MAG: glycosyltransferase family 9 protein [Patescibacteria group bacterium]
MSIEKSSGGVPEKKEKKKVVLVDVEDIREQAVHEAAERAMTESKENSSGFLNFFKKRIWKHGLAHEYYRQKEVARAREAIRKNEDIYAAEQNPAIEKTAHEEAMVAIVERFSQEYKETLHTGETRRALKDEKGNVNPLKDELSREISHLVREYASGKLDDDNFNEARKTMFNGLSAKTGGRADAMYANNLLEIARQARMAVEHGTALEALDLDFEIVLGKAKSSVGTEANYNMVDKAIEVLRKSPIGTLVNESTLAAGVAIASAVTLGLGRRVLTSKAAAWATFGASAVLAGAFTGIAENKRFKEDRKQHARERAQGRTWDENSPRRAEMETFSYEMRGAQELTSKLHEALYAPSGEKRVLTPEQLESAIGELADIEARIQLNDREKIDLVSYSDPAKVERERLNLDIARAKAKVDMRNLEAAANLPAGKSVDEMLALAIEARTAELVGGRGGIAERNDLFNKMKSKRAWRAATIGFVGGLAAGTVGQEIGALFNDQQTGLAERAVPGANATVLEHFRQLITGDTPPVGPLHEIIVGNGKVQLPESMTLVASNTNGGGYILMHGKTALAEGIQFTKDGVLDAESAKMLGEHGILTTSTVEQIQQTTKGIVGTKQYVEEHPELTKRVQRKLWYDNDTPKPVFDKNELKLWWGGAKNMGIDANGNYSFSIKQMLPGGSYHGNLSANAGELAKEGKLRMLFSISADTQSRPISVPIDADGTVHIDPNSETGKLLFKTVNGKAQFLGRFAEVAQVMSSHNDADQVRILATYEGKGVPQIATEVPKLVPSPRTVFGAPPSDFDLPPVLPIFGRKPLEPVMRPSKDKESYGYGYYEGRKRGFTDLSIYRNGSESLAMLEQRVRNNKKLGPKYSYVFERLDQLNTFDGLPEENKKRIKDNHEHYNDRYQANISLEEFLEREKERSRHQIENIAIEEAKVGERPFDKSFYHESPLLKGLERAEEVVICFDEAIGDAVLTVPVIDVLTKYLQQNKQSKKLVLITKHDKLLASLTEQYKNLTILNPRSTKTYFSTHREPNRFVINASKSFDQYDMLGLTPEKVTDPSNVLSVDWESWQEEEYPVSAGKKVRYYTIPARIARNFEVMLGQRLYKDINAVDHFIERGKNFETESDVIKKKYNIAPDAKLFVISAGASVTPKEYSPKKWKEVISGIAGKFPNAQFLLLDDPNPKRRERYGTMVDALMKRGVKISRADEGMDKMNTVMSMADYVLTPDTGLGHYAGALGKPTVMLFLADASLWSTPGSRPVRHRIANQMYYRNKKLFAPAWSQQGSYTGNQGTGEHEYFVNDGGILVGASDIDPKEVLNKIK